MKEFVGLRAKTYTYLMDDDIKKQKAKETKKFVIKCWVRNECLTLCCNVDGVLFLCFDSFEVLNKEGWFAFLKREK